MMEILFRGKKKNHEYIMDSKWLEGSLLKANFEGEEYTLIFGDKFILDGGDKMKAFSHALVIPETVGQYTGLCDKNGTKIFEGDILGYSEHSEHFRYLNNVRFAVFYDNLNACFAVERYVNGNYECKKRLAAFNPSEHLEVIGNIHDNPELLEENKNER